MRPRTWQLRRTHATGLAAIVLISGLPVTPAFAEQPPFESVAAASTNVDDSAPTSFPGVAAAYGFTWGNGIESGNTDVMPTWQANRLTQYGLVVQRYVLSDGTGVEARDQAGVSAIVGDPDTIRVSAELVYGAFTNFPARLNGSLDVTGATGHFKYNAAFAQTGIDGSPSAGDHRITTAGAALQFSNVTGSLGWASKFTSAYIAGELSSVSDGNHYHFEELGADQDLGLNAIDVAVGLFVNTSGYQTTYPYLLAGYYSYAAQERQALKAAVRYPLGRHFILSAIGIAGTSRTQLYSSIAYDTQTYQQFGPAIVYSNGAMQLSATGAFAQYLGGTTVHDYVSNQATVALRLRL